MDIHRVRRVAAPCLWARHSRRVLWAHLSRQHSSLRRLAVTTSRRPPVERSVSARRKQRCARLLRSTPSRSPADDSSLFQERRTPLPSHWALAAFVLRLQARCEGASPASASQASSARHHAGVVLRQHGVGTITLTLSQDETATLRWALESALRVASGNLANGQRIAGNRASSSRASRRLSSATPGSL